ncbi:MAG: CHAD domain-containing protein [Rubrobacteraceae bacterium]
MASSVQDRSSDQQEIEWQFDAFDVRPVSRWLEGGACKNPSISIGETREISDTYLDTGDWRIYLAGYALRIRHTKGKSKAEATMKLLASKTDAPGLRSRREISETLDSAEPEALKTSSGPVGKRVKSLIGPKALRPLFEVETSRSTYGLNLDSSEVGEIALDETAIPLENDAKPARIRRVEVEVEPEEVSRLELFVERLRDECRLSPAIASKYESGLFARELTPPKSPEFGPTVVDGPLSTGELAFRVLRKQFGVFLAHEPGTRIGEDPEELHDMRVATRRMRAAMKIFEKAVPVRTQKFRSELKWVAGALGEVRDLDVQLERLDLWVSDAELQDREPLEALRAVLERQREKYRRAMLRTLNSRRYAQLVESFGEFLRCGPSRRTQASRQPILDAGPDLVRKPHRKVRKLGDQLTKESSGEKYHELRKKGKRLRYALEFVSDIYRDPAKDLVKSLKKLQDVLGEHQDAEVAASRLRELSAVRGCSPTLPPETVFVMGGIAHRYETQAWELRKKIPKAYRRIKGKRWKNLEGTMEKRRPEETREA